MIKATGIVKRYGTLDVLKGIDLEIERGEIMAITGPSGAGKTTLLQIIGTIESADAGIVTYDGVDVTKLSDKKLSKFRNTNIGFVFQFHRLLPEFTLLENVAVPAIIGGMARNEAMVKARSLIEYMGLGPRAGHKPAELSGGERQRGAVARALVNSPAIVLADEPSGSLDSHNRLELHKLFFDLRRDMGQTFVIVTHDETLAADADRMVRMSDGCITSITRPAHKDNL